MAHEMPKSFASNSFTSSPTASTKHEGILSKWTNVMRGWQNRWFVLDPVHCTLEYYLTEEDRGQTPRASIRLQGATVAPSSEDAQTFLLHAANGEIYKLKAHDVKERQKWVNLLRCVISPAYGVNTTGQTSEVATSVPATSNSAAAPTARRGSLSGSGGSKQRSMPIGVSLEPAATAGVLRVDEPFAPARLVISKVRDKRAQLCQLIEGLESQSVSLASLEPLSPELLLLKASSLASWDCLHQCLFALMNTESHDNGTVEAPALVIPITTDPTPSPVVPRNTTATVVNAPVSTVNPSPPPPSRAASVNEAPVASVASVADSPEIDQTRRTSRPSSPDTYYPSQPFANITPPPVVILPTSDSSANMVRQGPSPSPRGPSPAPLPTEGEVVNDTKEKEVVENYEMPEEDELTDAEESDVGELGSVESEKSVILHLIGQLKIGMDLTKVTLPTFILERRSLLEMFADYMGHASLLLRVPDLPTPEERMIGVLEWYLTSFHMVRRGTQAKKPYNPIIGETFHCSWRVPTKDTNTNQPAQRVVYVGEQVSHHPPVTAFYIECPAARMCMSASIYTQSKFYGLSIGVNMVGQARLMLTNHGEEYLFTLPSAYARSILTVPWCELGGRVSIECRQSGYASEITFHTKPFYGGKLHRVTADVMNVAGKTVCKVSGEWNSHFEFQYTSESVKPGSRTVDVSSLPVVRKRVRPVERQGPWESRRLWNKVSDALARENIELATQEKNALEEVQRRGEKQRKAANQSFPNKFFHLEDGAWCFNDPLDERERKSSLPSRD